MHFFDIFLKVILENRDKISRETISLDLLAHTEEIPALGHSWKEKIIEPTFMAVAKDIKFVAHILKKKLYKFLKQK